MATRQRPPLKSVIALAGALLLAAAVAAFVWWPQKHRPAVHPAAGVTFTGEGDSRLRQRVSDVIERLRQRDASGIAEFDVDLTTHRRSPDGEAGAQWLITHFATPLQGPVQAEIRQDENAGLDWYACISYGHDQRKLRLDFVTYGKKGVWPDPNGGDKYAFPVHVYNELAGRGPYPNKPMTGLFCNEGESLPPAQ
ncbi:hypothetical protein EBO15_15085 [Actinomadura harenae]|uniref:Uncharacterized protein n=2 Tax=Actinomadura harenae TaxID=2483351 RepID=A0A3M2M4P2_9ACTN|nr:hypothetical protein EBO15_15085 [Actinomadura harenae]